MSTETHTFQAETRQLLDIVIHSLYTDKEIFLRELVSNAADALSKLRFHQLKGEAVHDEALPLEISITTDDTAGTITLTDHGIGLTRAELVEHLGTIARSGSKAFAAALQEARAQGGEAAALNMIGQFGVGFYSAFMVAEEVRVYTRSWRAEGENLVWISDGAGSYRIEDTPDAQRRGAKIVLKLKESEKDFASAARVESILRRYSAFIPYPIHLNGTRLKTVEALWMRTKAEVKPEEYVEFYKFQANAFDEPRHTLHFNADAPITINALLFSPQENFERFGMGRAEHGVALYCKKVLIDAEPKGLLPDWLRFLKGVVDSADLPLNISRETMQDSALVQKLNKVLTGRYLKHLAEEAEKQPDAYADFYKEFGLFLKEGAATDYTHREKLAKLLRFESSRTEAGKLTSLTDYVSRMKDGQTEIYWLAAPRRAQIEGGPFLEAFVSRGLEVLFLYEGADEFVMNHLGEFEGKKLVGADRADLKLEDAPDAGGESLSDEQAKDLCAWLKETLGARVKDVAPSKRLVDSPAVALNADNGMSAGMRRMLRAMKQEEPGAPAIQLEVNPRHALIRGLANLRQSQPDTAKLLAEQLCDTAAAAAGLLEDTRSLVARSYELMGKLAR